MIHTPLLNAAVDAETVNAGLLAGPGAQRLIAELTKIANDHSCELISGASPIGHQLVGALIYATHGKLRLWTPSEDGNVLAVDGVVVGLSGLQSHMALLRRLTASRVHGVALASSGLTAAPVTDIHVLAAEPLIASVA